MKNTTITVSKELAKKLNRIKYNSNYKNLDELLTNKIIKDFCVLCGKEDRLQEHHVDYNKNFTIKVCSTCHGLFNIIHKNSKTLRIITVKCPYCEYTWVSKAINPDNVSCPDCLRKVNISQNKINVEETKK